MLNIKKEHYKLHNYTPYNFKIADSKNIDILMEKGIGKTFTYINTIFELSIRFRYKKFIVLVPSVAIREGTKSQFEDPKDYFKSIYANKKEKEIEVFVSESGNISTIRQFIMTSHLSVLIMTPSSFRHKDNILNGPLENDFYQTDLFQYNQNPPKTYLEYLKHLNPIVVIDEPHKFDGDVFKRYFEGFKFLFKIRCYFPK